MDEQNCVNFVSNLAFQSRRMTPGLPTRKKTRISEYGKEEEEAEENIPLTERNSSKIKAAHIKVAVPGCGCTGGLAIIAPWPATVSTQTGDFCEAWPASAS